MAKTAMKQFRLRRLSQSSPRYSPAPSCGRLGGLLKPLWLAAETTRAMARPEPFVGQYWCTYAKNRCKAYTAPPLLGAGGQKICTIQPGVTLGPVENWVSTPQYVTILVRGYWINVWCSSSPRGNAVFFAHPVPVREVEGWKRHGWVDYD